MDFQSEINFSKIKNQYFSKIIRLLKMHANNTTVNFINIIIAAHYTYVMRCSWSNLFDNLFRSWHKITALYYFIHKVKKTFSGP